MVVASTSKGYWMVHMYTIGHSRRTLDEFIGLLDEHDIEILVDVRSFPSSPRYPHFNRESLAQTLQRHGIRYEWLGEQLGGYRKKGLGENSPNKAWKSQGFRNYADHTLTERFREGIRRLLELAESSKLVFICAEQLYWRCHRQIISDYLKVKGHVLLILTAIAVAALRSYLLSLFLVIKPTMRLRTTRRLFK
jgi:uncharacterized protein (DUF488 family)